tara:strand:- start:1592 stop:3658 length:2067 start_codon:yes stop_codon:yes gene_type:complete
MTISPDIMQDIMDYISKHEWATEDTLTKIANNKKIEYDTLKKAYEKLTGKRFPYDYIKKELDNSEDAFVRANKISTKVESSTTKLLNIAQSNNSSLESTAELMKMTAGAIDGATGVVTDYTKFLGPFGFGVSTVAKGVTSLGVAAAGVAAIYAKLMTEQETAIRSFIETGAVVNNINQYTDMRNSVSNVGMSLQELSKMMTGNKTALANMPGDLASTTIKFANFASSVENSSAKTMGDFGYNVEQLTQRLLEETELRYKSGKLEAFNQASQDKIRKNFENSSKMTTFLAGIFGDQRSSILASRNEALSNQDFNYTMFRNAEYIAKTYGENADENIRNNFAYSKTLFSLLGPKFEEYHATTVTNFIKDLPYDENVVNNMPAELHNMLSNLGVESLNMYQDLVVAAHTGKIETPEYIMGVQKFVKLISEATPRSAANSTFDSSNELIAYSRTAPPEAFMSMTRETIDLGIASVQEFAELADGSIDAIDDARIAFRNIVDAMTPDVQTSADVSAFFARSLDNVVSVMKFVGLIDRDEIKEPYVNAQGYTSRIGTGHPSALRTEEGGRYGTELDARLNHNYPWMGRIGKGHPSEINAAATYSLGVLPMQLMYNKSGVEPSVVPANRDFGLKGVGPYISEFSNTATVANGFGSISFSNYIAENLKLDEEQSEATAGVNGVLESIVTEENNHVK